MFLTAAEVVDLTGYRQASAQVKWLQRNGISHYVRGDGQVRVPREFFAARTAAAPAAAQPNFAALGTRH